MSLNWLHINICALIWKWRVYANLKAQPFLDWGWGYKGGNSNMRSTYISVLSQVFILFLGKLEPLLTQPILDWARVWCGSQLTPQAQSIRGPPVLHKEWGVRSQTPIYVCVQLSLGYFVNVFAYCWSKMESISKYEYLIRTLDVMKNPRDKPRGVPACWIGVILSLYTTPRQLNIICEILSVEVDNILINGYKDKQGNIKLWATC